MHRFGIHLPHEQYPPDELLRIAKFAQHSGFGEAMCSDHFSPWLPELGHSGFAWSWLGSALEGTNLTFGTVCAPGARYHPAIIAQASATLAQMYPDRFWLAIGSGEFLNEHITGAPWPPKKIRNERLLESSRIMRALWRGETVTHDGLIKVHKARLASLPTRPPLLLGAALSEETAKFAGEWADGLITVTAPPQQLSKIIAAFKQTAGSEKPIFLQVGLSYAESEEEALCAAHREWRQAGLDSTQLADLATPEQFESACKNIPKEKVAERLRVSSDLRQHQLWLAADLELGFERIFLHNVGRNQHEFIEKFSTQILPKLC